MMTVEQALAAADEMYGLGSFVVESPDVHLVLPHLVTMGVIGDSSAGFIVAGPSLQRSTQPRSISLTGRFTGPRPLVSRYVETRQSPGVFTIGWGPLNNESRCECILVNASFVSYGQTVTACDVVVVESATVQAQAMLVRRTTASPGGLPSVSVVGHLQVSLRFADEELSGFGDVWPDGFATYVDMDVAGNDVCVLQYHELRIESISIASPGCNYVRQNPITPAVWLHLRRCSGRVGQHVSFLWEGHRMFNADRSNMGTAFDEQAVASPSASPRPFVMPRRVVQIVDREPTGET